jgi:hypothetical protein
VKIKLPPDCKLDDPATVGQVMQVHSCVEKTAGLARRNHTAAMEAVGEVKEIVAKRSADIVMIRKAVGIDESGKRIHRPILAMGAWEFTGKIGGGFSAIFIFLQIGHAIWPSILTAGIALWHRFIA